MKQAWWLSAAFIVVLAGCETATEPFFGTGGGTQPPPALGLTPAQASGSWSFTLRRTALGFDCPNGGLTDGQVLSSQIAVATDGTVAPTSVWRNPPSTLVRPLSGQVRLSDGFTDILFRAGGTNLSAAMRLQGSMTSTGTFTGTMADPAPGFNPVFSIAGCFYNVTGTRTG